MTSAKVSTFRAVLKDYLSDYETNYRTQKNKPKSTKSQKSPEKSALLRETLDKLRSPAPKSPLRDAAVKREKSGLSKESSTLSETSKARKKSDYLRFERNYQIWEQAKVFSKQQRNVQNKTKIQLQRDLIKARDELYRYNRESAQHSESKQREAAKAVKLAAEEALLETCKESLENDRVEKAVNEATPTPQSSKSTRKKRDTSKSPKRPQPRKPVETANDGNNSNTLSTPAIQQHQRRILTPFTDEVEDGGFEEVRAVEKDFSSIPWYQEQLYRLYGDAADYYLRPVMVPTAVKGVHPKLNEYGGQAGSDSLWSILRDESNSKLLRMDSRVPKHLKAAYSSFIRENLAPDRKPLQRNFCNEDDVPFLSRLLDQTKLHHVANLRYKLGVMHRMSKLNADRTRILTYNNPAPGLCDEFVAVSDYIPSWDATAPAPASSSKEIHKALMIKSADANTNADAAPDKWASHPRDDFHKLIFLTEQEAKTAPQFRQKFADEKEETPMLKPYCDYSEKPVSLHHVPLSPEPDAELVKEYTSSWKPLSMNALLEYTPSVPVKGQGQFRNGQPPMWHGAVTT